jgi:hypothetical protein
MFHRSLASFSLLLLGASCVPPRVATAPQDGPAPAAVQPQTSKAAPATATLARLTGFTVPVSLFSGALSPQWTPARPFIGVARDVGDASRALECLTEAVYYEARSEPIEGQEAVAQVVLNRVRNPAFPSSVCGVVYQGAERRTGCQFTFTCDGSMLARREPEAWERARRVAQAALDGAVYAPVGLATNYHTTAILPWWAQSLSKIATIGTQIFYRWRGGAGEAPAFSQRYAGVEPAALPVATPAAAAATAPAAPPALAATTVLTDGGAVAIHRGQADAPITSAQRVALTAGVRLHIGHRAGTGEEGPQEASAAEVHVHVGTPSTASGAI